MEERSLRITGANTTFFNKITKTLSKMLIPTRIGINGMLISIKRNSVIKAYENYTKENENYNEEELEKVADMKLKSALYYLKMNTSLFKTPIILDENNYLIGYNSDEIRRFFPREYRKFLSDL